MRDLAARERVLSVLDHITVSMNHLRDGVGRAIPDEPTRDEAVAACDAIRENIEMVRAEIAGS